ncbi:MAG: RNA-binding protein [Cytophagales bacterium]|nr:MAG: RNA-binding protein [Cytophagales bacterium]
MKKLIIYSLLILTASYFSSCKQKSETLFELLTPDQTNITFANTIVDTDSMSILDTEYIYNGGGVAIGDLNGDGLQDIFFTGNQVPNQLYLNRSSVENPKLEFENITEIAGVAAPNKWSQGVALIDINNDGKLDIYVCATFKADEKLRENMLFINQGNDKEGNPKFTDLAKQYGVADNGHSANAVFFDYDNDGDLDLYVLTNVMQENYFPNQYRKKITDGSSPTTDRLYRNDWSTSLNHPVFTNISKEAGILIEGYGHGIAVTDINQDGWKDIYVTNDYLRNDIFYINNGDGTFTDRISEMIKHQSYSAMGNDIADINNDGLADIISLDMLPASNKRKKLMIGANNYNSSVLNDEYNYDYQYIRNTLQYNQGNHPQTGLPMFSEIGFLANIFETDWSWSPLMMDFDNDGLRDLLITNGFPKDVTDHDFGAFRQSAAKMFASKKEMLDQIPTVKIPNYIFKNNGSLSFTNKSKEWGLNHASFTNGTAIADLDNDGDLDIVTNNINAESFIFKNTLNDGEQKSNWLRIRFEGAEKNNLGLGAKVWVYTKEGTQYYEHSYYRGFLSSSENFAHFGLGKNTIIDSIRVIWNDNKTELIKNIKANQVFNIYHKKANKQQLITNNQQKVIFQPANQELGINFTHIEYDFVDFNIQRTLPHKFSQASPSIAVADVNGDGLDDFFLGGGSRHHGTLFIQNQQGTFTTQVFNPEKLKIEKIIYQATPDPANLMSLQPIENKNKIQEDEGTLFFDADNDGDSDLYIASGSYEFAENSPSYQDRLYINDGKGNFSIDTLSLPQMTESKLCVKAADFDRDGDLDLFVGGRVVPTKYPMPTKSYILRNDSKKGKALFTDVTAQVCPALQKIGMVTDALWTDFDNDGQPDLLIVGEFMPITFFKNQNGKFILNSKQEVLNSKTAWWNSLVAGDFDNDGDTDYVAGNLGLNSMYKATESEPTTVYAKDFDGNGSYDAVLGCFMNDSLGNRFAYPMHSRDDMIKQMLFIRKKFPRYAQYGTATMDDIFSKDTLQGAQMLKATYFESSYIENQGNGNFALRKLPIEAQFAPVFGMKATDIDQDGNLDLLLIGNDYGSEVFIGRLDAFYGLYLKGDGKGNFAPVSLPKSGFIVEKDGKALASLFDKNGKEIFIASQNKGKLKTFSINTDNNGKVIKLNTDDSWAEITFKDGKSRKIEFYYGDTYLSQSSRKLKITENMSKVLIYNAKGEKREIGR